MYFRHLFSRAARPCWQIAARGKRDLPIWRAGPSISDFFRRRPGLWDDPRFRDFWGPFGTRSMDDFLRENMRRMDTLFRMAPWRILEDSEAQAHGSSEDIIQAKLDKDGLRVEINVSHYDPDGVAVKVSGDQLVISGKHTSKPDKHGFVSREFTREFLIPENVDTDTLSCRLTEEGHLVVTATVKDESAATHNITIERDSDDKNKPEKE